VLVQDLPDLDAVLLGEALVVQVVGHAHQAPLVLVLAVLAGHVAHHRLHRQGMALKAETGVVLHQELPGFFSGRFAAHGLPFE
jgi:hypothetical protein